MEEITLKERQPKDRFIKVPIKNLLKRLPNKYNPGVELTFNESQWAMMEGLEDHRFWVHISARRTGKSWAASVIALAKLLEPNQQVIVVAPNYNLSSIIWDYVTDFLKELQIETRRFNSKDKIVELINGSVFRLLSANNRDSLIGRQAHLLIIDEAAIIQDDEYFTRDLRPALSTFDNSRALFISTPRGKLNYLYSYYNRGPDPEFDEWGSATFPWYANKLLKEKDIKDAEKTLPRQIFLQEYYCDWAVFEGQIYEVDEERHQTTHTPDVTDYRIDVIAGLDMGYRDMTAMCVVAVVNDTYYVIDSYRADQSATSVHASAIQELIDEYDIDMIYIDSAAAQTKADLAYDYDIYCELAVKNVNDGIAYIQTLVEKDRIKIHENCIDVYSDMAGYKWNLKTETQKPQHDDFSHMCDAVRYAIYTYAKTNGQIFSLGEYNAPDTGETSEATTL